MLRVTMNVELVMCDRTGNNWRHRNGSKRKIWMAYQEDIQ